MTTRLLLTVAAIAVAGGLVNMPNAFLFGLLSVSAPWALGVAAGLYLLPGLLAQATLRRAGVGLLAQLLAGLVAAPLAPTGIASISAYVLLGVLIEIPFAVRLYREWRWPLFAISALWVAAVYSVFWGMFYDTPSMGPLALIGQPAVLAASTLGMTAVALVLARLVARTGVLRGVRGPEVRRARGRASAADAAASSSVTSSTAASSSSSSASSSTPG